MEAAGEREPVERRGHRSQLQVGRERDAVVVEVVIEVEEVEPDAADVEPCPAKAVPEHDRTMRPAASRVAMDGSVIGTFLSGGAPDVARPGSMSRDAPTSFSIGQNL